MTAFSSHAADFLSEKFWTKASLADVQKEIKNGVDVNIRDEADKTALDYAKDNENIYDTPIYLEMKELMDK